MKVVAGSIRAFYRIAAVVAVLWVLLVVAGDPDGALKSIEGHLDRTGAAVRQWLSLPG